MDIPMTIYLNQSFKQCFQVNFLDRMTARALNLKYFYSNKISGTIPIPALEDGSCSEWTMYVDFGAHDSDVDISPGTFPFNGVHFETVNAVVVNQTKRLVN